MIKQIGKTILGLLVISAGVGLTVVIFAGIYYVAYPYFPPNMDPGQVVFTILFGLIAFLMLVGISNIIGQAVWNKLSGNTEIEKKEIKGGLDF